VATDTITISRRTVTWTLAFLAALLVSALLVARPNVAVAASTAGALQIRGVGTTYLEGGTASLAVAPGRTATYWIKVVNRGTSLAQFKLKTNAFDNPSTYVLLSGRMDLKPLSASSDGVVTEPIPAGESVLYRLNVTLPANANPVGRAIATVDLLSLTDAGIQQVVAATQVPAPAKGTTSADLFVRAATSEPFVGGSYYALAMGTPLKPGASTTMTVRLQNDGTSPSTIALVMNQNYCADTFPITVKDGSTDVTAAVMEPGTTYVTPSLAVGAKRDLKVTFKRTDADPNCVGTSGQIITHKGLGGDFGVISEYGVFKAAS
jgi:hypothetical protein